MFSKSHVLNVLNTWQWIATFIFTISSPYLVAAEHSTHPHNSRVSFSHIKTDNILPHPAINSIVQDHSGFMWFATQDGLNRFDGNRFEVFKASDKNSNSLANNYIYPLSLDNQNQLVIGTRYGGVNQLNLFNYAFSTPLLNSLLKLSSGAYHVSIFTSLEELSSNVNLYIEGYELPLFSVLTYSTDFTLTILLLIFINS